MKDTHSLRARISRVISKKGSLPSPALVIAFCALFVALGGSAFATKHYLTSGKHIAKGSIPFNRLSKVTRHRITNSVRYRRGRGDKGDRGPQGPKGDRGPQGPKGDRGPQGPGFIQSNWGVIDRNTIGSPQIDLRQGPGTPPDGNGSLEFLVGVYGGVQEKAAYGNEVDFVGDHLSDLDHAGFWVFQTGEDQSDNGGPGNLPNIDIELNPNQNGHGYSTLVFVPTKAATANGWTQFTKDDGWWYFTGSTGTDNGCDQAAECSFDEAKAAAPDATFFSVAVAKGRDDAWQGAIDDLRINDKVYNFEQLGVSAHPAT